MSRALAELATGAADDDARQDENHAGDTQQMGEMLRAQHRMGGMRVAPAHEVDGDVADPRSNHQGEAELAGKGEAPKLFETALYRQHWLVIHLSRPNVNVSPVVQCDTVPA